MNQFLKNQIINKILIFFKKIKINIAKLIEDELRDNEQLLEENGILTDQLNQLNLNHEELMKVYKGLSDQNQDLNENNKGIILEYAQLKENYEFLLKDNPKKLKKMQEELIQKHNSLFKEYSILFENHQKLAEDHENLKKIPIIPRISSTEDLDLILNDQLRNSNLHIHQELNSLRSYHQQLLDEYEEGSIIKDGINLQSENRALIVEESKKNEDSVIMNFSNSLDISKSLGKSERKSGDLENFNGSKIFEPFKIKENQLVISSPLQNSSKLGSTPTKIFGPMRNNFIDTEKKDNVKGYTLNNLPEIKKSVLRNSFNKAESKNQTYKLSEFIRLKKKKQPNKLEKALDDNQSLNRDFSNYGNIIQSYNHSLNKENKSQDLKKQNTNTYYLSERNFRGKVTEIDFRIFEHTKITDGQNLNKIKLGCLKNKSTIFETEILQIGCITSLEKNEKEKYFLKISLYITNKSHKHIVEGGINYIGDEGITLWTKPEIINSEIKSNGQIRQELMVDFSELPYPLLAAEYFLKY